jgi:hypothetical protein
MSSIDINKLSCGGSGYIEQVIESKAKKKECILIILSPPSLDTSFA